MSDEAISLYIENYGCTSSLFEYEIIRGVLEKSGCLVTEDSHKADVLIINSCGVKKQTEDKIVHRLRVFAFTDKPIIVTGCLPKINKAAILKAAPLACTVDPAHLHQLPEIVGKIVKKEIMHPYLNKASLKINMPKTRSNKLKEVLAISEGCLGECTYCCTRNARGHLISYPVDAIISSIKKGVNEGVKEVYLTSQDTGSYGLDIGVNLIQLLQSVVEVPGDFKVRIGMMNPDRAMMMIDSLSDLLNQDKMYRFLHVPVQSGSDPILTHMKRRYTSADFVELVKTLRKEVCNITISTDIIVGYPTETDEDFQRTLELLNQTRPEIVNVSRYMARPNTKAARLESLPQEKILIRSKTLATICKKISLETNRHLLKKKYWAIIAEKNSKGNYVARTDNYRRVVVTSPYDLLGKRILVQIEGFTDRYLLGSIRNPNLILYNS